MTFSIWSELFFEAQVNELTYVLTLQSVGSYAFEPVDYTVKAVSVAQAKQRLIYRDNHIKNILNNDRGELVLKDIIQHEEPTSISKELLKRYGKDIASRDMYLPDN